MRVTPIPTLQPTLVKALQKRVAYLAIGRSALRNQGSPGLIATCRNYVASIDLNKFSVWWNNNQYDQFLNKQTDLLLQQFPKSVRKQYGTARKALNLFFRDLVSNTHAVSLLKLNIKLLDQLELPLDSYTVKEILSIFPDLKSLWRGIKYLTAKENKEIQAAAASIAAHHKIVKVHLDIYWWRKDK